MFIRRVLLTVGLVVAVAATAGLSAKGVSSPHIVLPPALVTMQVMKAEDLLLSAQKLLPKGAFLGPLLDDHYAVISYDWLAQKFMPAYRESVEVVKDIASREAEGSDCDNYGMFLRQMMGLAGIVGQSAEPAAAQVIVFQAKAFSGVSSTRERHAVGLFLTERGWMVLEPQNATELVPFERYANRRNIRYITFH